MLGVVFPGQGSQHVGMGKFLVENFKEAKTLFEEAGDTLHLNFKKLCFDGPEEDLQLTKNTQPALLLVSTCLFEVLKNTTGLNPKLASGHSVGEYAALVTAQTISFQEALRAVRTRGEAMQEAVPVGEGAMCAVIGLTDAQVKELCVWVEKESKLKPLEPANFNAPGQVVVSGSAKAIEWLQANFKKEALTGDVGRAKFIPLKVSAPFHCSLMKPAEERMRRVLQDCQFETALWPVVQNFTAQPVIGADTLRENVIRQISSPVLWTQCVEHMQKNGITKVIECGSGKVLSGLIKKIAGETITCTNINSLEELKNFETIARG